MILKANREELVQHIDACLKEMTDVQIDNVFGGLYYEPIIQQMSPFVVLEKIKESDKNKFIICRGFS